MVQVCKEHDPDPRRSMPLPRPRTSTPIGERPRRWCDQGLQVCRAPPLVFQPLDVPRDQAAL